MKKNNTLFYKYFNDWIDRYKVGLIAEVTLKKYRINSKFIEINFPDLKIFELNRKKYQDIINEYAKTHEKQTVKDFHHQIKGCIKDLFYDGELEKDPTYKAIVKGKDKTRKSKPKYLQTDELRLLIQSLDLNSGINKDWLLLILAKTGLRFAEALALTPDDFDFSNQRLSISKTWIYKSAKGGFGKTKNSSSVRTIVIDWHIVGQLQPLIKDLPVNEPIFVGKNEQGHYIRIFNSTYNDYLEKKCGAVGIPVISIHGLRHTHASVLLTAQVSINSISARLGHSEISTTQETYAHLLDELEAKDNQKMMATLMQIA